MTQVTKTLAQEVVPITFSSMELTKSFETLVIKSLHVASSQVLP
jgi:hypothetical protein